jgi:hypothetical protein
MDGRKLGALYVHRGLINKQRTIVDHFGARLCFSMLMPAIKQYMHSPPTFILAQ